LNISPNKKERDIFPAPLIIVIRWQPDLLYALLFPDDCTITAPVGSAIMPLVIISLMVALTLNFILVMIPELLIS
jgi:hypothetical protein